MKAKDVAKIALGKEFNEETYCDKCWKMRVRMLGYMYCPNHVHYYRDGDPELKEDGVPPRIIPVVAKLLRDGHSFKFRSASMEAYMKWMEERKEER